MEAHKALADVRFQDLDGIIRGLVEKAEGQDSVDFTIDDDLEEDIGGESEWQSCLRAS
jgi:hypothetical protein